jgi:hypothetical protein
MFFVLDFIVNEKHLLRMMVLIKVLVDTHATGCKTQQLNSLYIHVLYVA